MHIKKFQGKKHLLLPTVEHIDDIGDVAEMESDDEQLTVAVLGCESCEEYLSCVNCSSKIMATLKVVDCG